MKQVFTDPSEVPCDLLKRILEGQGIKALIKNAHGGAGTGGGDPIGMLSAPSFADPEVWVSDEDYEVAAEVAAGMQLSQEATGAPWTCTHCGETVDADLNVCWNCETPQPIEPDPPVS
jgi:hypothetical protein